MVLSAFAERTILLEVGTVGWFIRTVGRIRRSAVVVVTHDW